MIAFGVVVAILFANFVALLFLFDVIPYLFGVVEFLFPGFTGSVVEVDVTIGKGVGKLDMLFEEVMKLWTTIRSLLMTKKSRSVLQTASEKVKFV